MKSVDRLPPKPVSHQGFKLRAGACLMLTLLLCPIGAAGPGPTAPEAPALRQARAALDRSDAARAERVLRAALDTDVPRRPVLRLLADVLLRQGLAEALGTLLDGVPAEEVTMDPFLAQRRVESLLIRGGPAQARAAAELAIDHQGDSPRLRYLLALIAADAEDWSAVAEQAERALRIDSSQADARYLLLQAWLRRGEQRRAADACAAAREAGIAPGAYVALCLLVRPRDGDALHVALGLAAGTDPLFPLPLEALATVERVPTGEELPPWDKAHPDESGALLLRYLHAARLLQFGRAGDARTQLEALSTTYLDMPLFGRLLGIALIEDGAAEAGLRSLAPWADQHPEDREAYRLWLAAAVRLGNSEQIDIAERALENQRFMRAEPPSALDQALRLPGGAALGQLAWLLHLERERKAAALILEQYPLPAAQATEALLALDKLARREPSHPAVSLYRSLQFSRRGEYREARRSLELALASAPNAPAIVLLQANAALRDGDADRARGLLRQLVFRRPDHAGARRALGQLDTAENVRRAREGLPPIEHRHGDQDTAPWPRP